MRKENLRTRYIALLCSFIIVFSIVLTGCGAGKKITKNKNSAANGDEIQIGQGSDILEGPTQIVVGENGQSYIVDNEGHSVIYNNPTQSGGSYSASKIATTAPRVTTSRRTTPTKKNTTTRTTAEPTSTPSAVYNALAPQRKFGFNAAYDWGSKFVNFYLSTIRIYFTFDNKDWLIELWKGEYAMATVGCEVGFYYRTHNQNALDTLGANNLLYKCVEDEDAMPVSMKLWQYEKSTDATPKMKIDYAKRNCWWAADFETGVLEKHRDQTTLVMIATIDFPASRMRDLFTDGLEKEGFKEGSINSYNNIERFKVDGNTVTVCWKNYDYSKAHNNAD